MAKFEIGQTVKVKSIHNSLQYSNGHCMVGNPMHSMVGKKYTIDNVLNSGHIAIKGWYFNEKDLIPCDNKSSKFDISKLLNGGEAIVDTGEYDGYDDVKFEGYLCSATFNNETGDKVYFTINDKGNALKSFRRRDFGLNKITDLKFNIKNKDNDKRDCPIINKPDVISVVRHFRRWDNDLNQISNMGGLTVLCDLDYSTNTMHVYPAFCSISDNFDKAVGLKGVMTRKKINCGITFRFDRKLSIFDNIKNAILIRTAQFTTISARCTVKNLVIQKEFFKCFEPQCSGRYSPIFHTDPNLIK